MAAGFSEPARRWGHLSAPVEGRICMLGGCTESEPSPTLHVFDFYLEAWREFEVTADGPSPPPGLYEGASTSSGQHVFIYGGHDGVCFQGSLYELDISTLKWHQLAATSAGHGPMRKRSCGMVCHHDLLILFGGFGFQSGPTQLGAKFVKCEEYTDGRGWSNELHTFSLKEGEKVYNVMLYTALPIHIV